MIQVTIKNYHNNNNNSKIFVSSGCGGLIQKVTYYYNNNNNKRKERQQQSLFLFRFLFVVVVVVVVVCCCGWRSHNCFCCFDNDNNYFVVSSFKYPTTKTKTTIKSFVRTPFSIIPRGGVQQNSDNPNNSDLHTEQQQQYHQKELNNNNSTNTTIQNSTIDNNNNQKNNNNNNNNIDQEGVVLIPNPQQQEEQKLGTIESNIFIPATSSMANNQTQGKVSTVTTTAAGTGVAAVAADVVQTSRSSTSSTTGLVTKIFGLLQQIRHIVFPIYGSEDVTKFFYVGFIKFFIILALTLTRDCKDTLIVTSCGAEAITFLKIYGVLPCATIYIAYYSQLSNILLPNKQLLFYCTCIPFFLFFLFFDQFIYPNTKLLHPTLPYIERIFSTSSSTTNGNSGGLTVLMNILCHWTYAVYYIVAEIYSSVSVSLLFWQYANDVVSIEQAKKYYPLFAQMSGLAPVLAGQYVVNYATNVLSTNKGDDDTFLTTLHRLTYMVTFSGIMICYFYYISNAFIQRTEGGKLVTASNNNNTIQKKTKKSTKPKLTMMESIKFLASSHYLRLLATMVIGYGLSINFTEIMWKSLVKKQYPDPLQYQRYMGQFSSIVGLSTCIVIFFGVHVIRILGWRIGALATPTIMSIVSIPFFACVVWPSGGFSGIGSIDQSTPGRLRTAVIFGTLNSLLSKTAKYALFDPTTQMAYIPLDEESKIKGKAAIDVLGSRIGKSGGSFIQQGLVLLFGTILNASPIVGFLYYFVLFAWIHAANQLSTLFQKQSTLRQHEDEEEEEQQQQTHDLQLQEETTENETKKIQ